MSGPSQTIRELCPIATINNDGLMSKEQVAALNAQVGDNTVTDIKTSAYVAAINETVRVDPAGGAFDVTLPTATGVAGEEITIKHVSSSPFYVTVLTTGGQTIDSLSSVDVGSFESHVFESDGTNWMEI
jgi:hypothetical protein